MAKEIELSPGKLVGSSHPCFIIAEVGQNHQGDMDTAKSLIKAAKVGMVSVIYVLLKRIVWQYAVSVRKIPKHSSQLRLTVTDRRIYHFIHIELCC